VKVHCRNRSFDVFKRSEADATGIVYSADWRNASEGDWILTADDMVLRVLGRRICKRGKNKKSSHLIRTGYGETPTYKPQLYARKLPDYEWDIRYKKNLVRNVKPTALQSAFIQQLVDNFEPNDKGMWSIPDLIDSYMSVYCDNNPSTALRRALAILRKDSVKQVMSELMKDRFENIGVDDDYVANKYKDFIEDVGAPASTRLQALNRVSDILGHVKKEEKNTEQTVFMLTDGDKKLLAQHKKQLPDEELSGNKIITNNDIKKLKLAEG
jgi:hypothetical protein